ncbi:MAG: hydroxyethylthiazole kinase [Alphaproteobacteria bacterium]|nr:MAG: hydroxyethylthiazole kinase [Alphaproteobacteria bacterium]
MVSGAWTETLDEAEAAIAALRAGGVRVHCLTNAVAQNFTANVLLACGATPSMTVNPDESVRFTDAADALLVNLGTLDADRRAAMAASTAAALAAGKPVVLDPVMCQLSPPRLAFARELLARRGLILKANAAEAAALGQAPAALRVVTGPVDRIETQDRACGIANGHPLMGRVVAVGCALGAVIAALGARAGDPAGAALAGLAWFGVAGEVAARKAAGPGSFAVAFLDALAALDAATVRARARIVP